MMQQYKIKPNVFEPFRTRMKGFILFLYGSAFLYLTIMIGVNEFTLIVLMIVAAIILGTFYMIDYMIDKWQKPVFESYVLTITSDAITRHQFNTPTIAILKSEITEIVKGKYGNMIIIGNNKGHIINIPSEIEDKLAIENELSIIYPLPIKTKSFIKQHIIAAFVSLVLMLCYFTLMFWGKAKIEIAFSALISTFIIIWLTIRQYKNIDMDMNTKKIAYLSTLMQLIFIFYSAYSKLKGI